MSRTSKYYKPIKTIHRQVRCLWCGQELEHAPTGRPKRYCCPDHRVRYNRAMKKHARECAEAALAGEPEPERDFGYPIEFATYEIEGDEVRRRDEK